MVLIVLFANKNFGVVNLRLYVNSSSHMEKIVEHEMDGQRECFYTLSLSYFLVSFN